MKILVCISKAPDTTSKIAFTEGNTKFDENGIQYIINPYDEWYALAEFVDNSLHSYLNNKTASKFYFRYDDDCGLSWWKCF